MAKRICIIRIDGHERPELYDDMIAVEVCEQEAESNAFALKLGVFARPDGTWTLLDDGEGPAPSLRLWQRITIEAGFDGNSEVLIDGYIAGMEPEFGPSQVESSLLVWGHDASYAMDQEEKIVSWDDRKFSDVATEIFQSYGLDPVVEDSQVVHATDDNLLLQRGTDWSFLKLLAARVGFEVFVRGAKGYFRKPQLSTTPQADINVNFGHEATNALWFKPKFVGNQPSRVRIARANPIDKIVETVEVDLPTQRVLAGRDVDEFRAGRDASGTPRTIVQPVAFGSEQEMEAFVEGVRRHHDWVVHAEGELDGRLYGHALRARRLVAIRGAGRQYSGTYYVSKVIHRLTLKEYRQRFWIQRNGVEPNGTESYDPIACKPKELTKIQAKGAFERVQTRLPGRQVAQ